jgi:hypothetical protein
MRRQYVVLTAVFLTMLTYNLTSEHRIAKTSAQIMQLEGQRARAEDVTSQFNQISQTLAAHKAKAEVVGEIDSRINVAAVLAEISHVVGDRVILSRVDFVSEPVAQTEEEGSNSGSAVRAAGKSNKKAGRFPLGDTRFRIVLAGVAVRSGDVAALVCDLDESRYFQKVDMSFSRPGQIDISPKTADQATGRQVNLAEAKTKTTFQVTTFEIVCYLANYEEIDN